jgi:hypothetical protein
MTTQYYGDTLTPIGIKNSIHPGALIDTWMWHYELIDGLSSRGYRWEYAGFEITQEGFGHGFETIKRNLRMKRPVIISFDIYDDSNMHAAVVSGFDDDDSTIFIRDPRSEASQIEAIPYLAFFAKWRHKLWNTRSAILTAPKGEVVVY